MFTGIIQGRGEVVHIEKKRESLVLSVKPAFKISGIKLGESIAIDGCCLTVVDPSPRPSQGVLKFDVSDETLRKTTLGSYKIGKIVNIERAMLPTDRLGGHFVLGHVDGVGVLSNLKKNEGSVVYEIKAPKDFSRYLIQKGSVTIDGISLTVSLSKKTNHFSVYVIPHTLKITNLPFKKIGDAVNLEADVLGKYVARLLSIKD